MSAYGAAKAGVVAFSQALAKEVAQFGVIVNVVAPGLAQTGLTRDAPSEFLEAYKKGSALRRLCTPEDIAPVVAFLASDICSYIVGQVVRISAS